MNATHIFSDVSLFEFLLIECHRFMLYLLIGHQLAGFMNLCIKEIDLSLDKLQVVVWIKELEDDIFLFLVGSNERNLTCVRIDFLL